MSADPSATSLQALLADARWLQALARRLVADPEAADDLLQEAWLVALERPPREAGAARGWFARVLANLGRMRGRSERARGVRERAHARGERTESAADVVERAESQRWLVERVLELDEPGRSTVLWHFFDGLSSAAIARRAGVPESTVRTRLARGLAELRGRLERERGRSWAVGLAPLAGVPAREGGAGLGIGTWMGVVSMKGVLAFCAAVALAFLLWRLASQGAASPIPGEALARSESVSLVGTQAVPAPLELESAPARTALDAGSEAARRPDLDELLGRVLTSAGQPIAGARVRIVQPLARQWPRFGERLDELEREIATAETDERGEFRLRVPARRVLDLVASADGFASVKRPNLYGGERQELVLARGASLTGRITRKRDGEALAGVLVRLSPGVLGTAGAPTHSTGSDADGRYHIEGLAPGFYAGFVGYGASIQLTLAEGEEAHRDVALAETTTLSGCITDGRDEQPLRGARVWLGYEDEAVLTDADGTYRIDVAAHDALPTVHASAPGFGRFERRLAGPVENGDTCDIFLLPGRRARGRVVDAHGAPVPGAYMTAGACAFDEPYRLDVRSVRCGDDGRFELTDLRVDLRHTLLVRAEGHASAVFDLPASEWELTDLELGDLPLEPVSLVSGRVVDREGRALADLWVQAIPEPSQRDRLGPLEDGRGYLVDLGVPIEARTDASGRFAFTDLPSGRCFLSAGAKGWVRRGELELVLEPGCRLEDVVLSFDPGLSISGVVVDGGGRVLPRLVINLAREGDPYRLTYDLTREDGSFSIHGLDPGRYRLETGPGPGLGVESVAARDWGSFEAGASGLRLVVSRGAYVCVRVVDRTGAALAGAYVGIVDVDDNVPRCEAADEQGRIEVLAPEGEPVDLRAFANRHFDPRADFFDAFFRDEAGEIVPDTVATVRGIVAGSDEVTLVIPGLP